MIVGGLSSQFPLAPNAKPVHDEPMQGEELRRIVEIYEGFGIHRAGTDVDRAVVDWMEGRFAALGLSTTRLDACLLYTSPSPRDLSTSRMPSSA